MFRIALFVSAMLTYTMLNAQCTTQNVSGCECENPNDVSCDLLPDITISWEVGYDSHEEYPPGEGLKDAEINYEENWFEITPEIEAMGRLRVSAMTPNIGSGPLNLRGADQNGYRWMVCYENGVADTFQVYDPDFAIQSEPCADGTNPKHISWQRVYQKNSDGSMSFYEEMVGTMEYHPLHGHMHFNEWTILSLRIPDPDNMDNPMDWEIVGEGAKVGFCVMDLGNCNSGNCRDEETVYGQGNILYENDFPNYGFGGGGYNCSPIYQGISVGYTDTYGRNLDGMYLNIPLGTCNGDYAVVLEVPQVMVESRTDNNYTWFPVTLTMQTEVPDVSEIVSSSSGLMCEGDEIELSIDIPSGADVEWSNGSVNESITVNSFGSYTATVTTSDNECPAIRNYTFSGLENVDTTPQTVCKDEPGVLSVESDYVVTWYNQDMEFVGSGNTLTTNTLQESTTFYVSNSFVNNSVGPEQHSGNSDYSSGQDAIGFLSFDALDDFTLESVNVYTNEPGDRKFVLMNADNEVVAEHTEFIGFADNEPQTVVLNFDIASGSDYKIGTDGDVNQVSFGGQNPQLKRTGTQGDLSFPYIIDGKVSINKSVYYSDGFDGGNGDDYTTYYYYMYDWVVSGDTISCDPVAIPVTVEDCSSIEEVIVMGMNIYPNPSNGIVEITADLNTKNSINLILTNSLGQEVYKEAFSNITSLNQSYNWSYLPKGIYIISLETNNQRTIEKIVLQ